MLAHPCTHSQALTCRGVGGVDVYIQSASLQVADETGPVNRIALELDQLGGVEGAGIAQGADVKGREL